LVRQVPKLAFFLGVFVRGVFVRNAQPTPPDLRRRLALCSHEITVGP
jgi:hypothetical protein